MTDLEEITGVGPSVATNLDNAGFGTAEDVAAADPSDLADITLFGADPEDIVAAAVEETAVDDTEPVDLTEGMEIDIDLNEYNYDHLYSSLLNEIVRAESRGRSDGSRVRTGRGLLRDLRSVADEVPEGDDLATFTFVWTGDDLNFINSAIRNWYNNFRFPPYIERIGSLVDHVEEIREEHVVEA